MINNVVKPITIAGIVTYCNAIIYNEHTFYLLSFFGRPVTVKALTAAIMQDREIIIDQCSIKKPYLNLTKILTYSTPDKMCHKIIYTPELFHNNNNNFHIERIMINQDLDYAFNFINSITHVPLKKEWKNWVWENLIDKEELYSFGYFGQTKIHKAYKLSLKVNQDEIEHLIIEAIKNKEIS